MTISDRIKDLREKSNLNQEEFGKRIGVKRGVVTQWEAGNNNPKLETLVAICKEFNVTADSLIFGTTETGTLKSEPEPSNFVIVEMLKEIKEQTNKLAQQLGTLAGNRS